MKTIQERFEEKYEVDPFGCWLWTSAKYGNERYGVFRLDNRNQGAHRASWQLYNGDIPSGLCVLHKCDVGLCVNPEHLFLGTQTDNVHDMMNKGRQNFGHGGHHNNHAYGENSGVCKLPWNSVLKIRTRYKHGEHNKAALAREFCIGESQIRRIVALESRING